MSLKVVTLADRIDERVIPLQNSCKAHGVPLEIIGEGKKWSRNAVKLQLLSGYLASEQISLDDVILVVDAFDVVINAGPEELLTSFESLNTDIVFSAEANYYFREPSLRYYYWKFYPRGNTFFDYLNSGSFMGKAVHLEAMINDIQQLYDLNLNDEKSLNRIRSDQYVFSRFYADCATGFFKAGYTLSLDQHQTLFACTGGRMTVARWPLASKIHSFLFFQYERKLLKTFGLAFMQRSSRDLTFRGGHFFNRATATTPLVVHLPATRAYFNHVLSAIKGKSVFHITDLLKPLAILVSLAAYLQSWFSLGLVRYFNRGVTDQQQIFRYGKNLSQGYDESAGRLTNLLQTNVPFSFSHYNDGELTFINKYLNSDNKEEWFGRKQHSYSPRLGEQLVDAFRKKADNYFVGVPCSTCHPELKAVADNIRGADSHTIPAMTIHHNLSYLPSMLGAIKGRKLYFVLNEYQELTMLRNLGLQVDDAHIIRVPFKNSYELFDDLKDKHFDDGAVVLMMCGMLAKILSPVWFEQNPGTTFIAFGSSLDDFIQRDKIKFRLFPQEFPFTRNIHTSRSFLFGYKKPCAECYRLT